MSYANDGWGPDNINKVFAHESCHIFGAADEYGSCVCGSVSGHLSVPNSNCVNCFPPGAQIPCLMNANTLAMCEFSRRQIGWDASLFPSSVTWDLPRMIPDWFGWENQGGDIAIADIAVA
ncbi:hypothetical protein [Candidatus Electronema sp. JM]|uniref:hypothetical protein n=1 Tax=Candidatus Electronema sp. JM TaxID=3401571 RepID=UPI003AA7D344